MAKHILILICLFFFTANSFSQSQGKADASSKTALEELTKITSEIYDAGISRNKSVIEKYFAETYLETDALGVLRDKAWNLANLLPTNEKITYKIEDAQVREYDKVAVFYYKWIVRYEVTTPAEVAGTKDAVTIMNAQLQVTDTFIKTQKGWQIISSSRVRLRNEQNVSE